MPRKKKLDIDNLDTLLDGDKSSSKKNNKMNQEIIDTESLSTKLEEENNDIKEKKKTVSVRTGLTYDEVKERIANNLVNVSTTKTSKTVRQIILSNIFTVFNILNIAVAIWLLTVGSFKNLTFMAVISANIIIGIIQEIRAKKTIDSLSLISAPSVSVLRNGRKEVIKPEEVVLDDIMILDAGKQICADAIVRKGSVEVNESLLTGEADAVFKKPGSILLSGSFIVSGECYAKVEHIGDDNYIQKLTSQAKKFQKPKSDILRSLNLLAKIIVVLVIVMGALLFFNQYFIADHSYEESVISTAGGIIGMIPSGLFLITSISLAWGVIKLSRCNTLVNDLYSIEMLARVNVLCLDKTGTITDGSMKVRDVVEYKNPFDLSIKQIIANIQGSLKDSNPTSIALEKKFGKVKKATATKTIPFSSSRKYSACYFKDLETTFLLGAPEFILGNRYDSISKNVESYAKLGYRVIILASSKKPIVSQDDEFKDAEVVALIAIEDTIRKDAIDTIDYFKKSGVMIKVISGDNPLTVSKVAKRAGIVNADKYLSLDGLSDSEIERLALEYTVFGRVTPAQKKLLIQVFKQNDGVVAMTGDGVNDILALKEADCSIAMANGSEAARNVSNLVLLDSNFASMPKVVSEGRRVINNIQRGAALYLTKTIFSVLLSAIVVVLAFKIPVVYPIQTIQLMLYDILITGIPSLYLAVEPNNTQIKGKFMQNVISRAAPGGLLIVANYLIIIAFRTPLNMSNEVISTLTVLMTTAVGFMILYRTFKPFNPFRILVYSMMFLFLAVAISMFSGLLEFAVLEIPHMLLLAVLILASTHVFKGLSYLFSFMVKDKRKVTFFDEIKIK